MSDDPGIIVTVSANPQATPNDLGPTRYQLALRRQAANRTRKAQGRPALPALTAGGCEGCEGWGVTGAERSRCRRCRGTGER